MTTGALFEALFTIPDHRTKKGRRFSLAAIVTISLAAMLSGANDLIRLVGIRLCTDTGVTQCSIQRRITSHRLSDLRTLTAHQHSPAAPASP